VSVPKVLVSNNSEVLRHLKAPNFRGLGLFVQVVSDGTEALHTLRSQDVDLAILDAELAEVSGYDVVSTMKREKPESKAVLVISGRISAAEMRRVSESGCDEVLIAPMGADELYDVVAITLGLPRRGSERYSIDLSIVGSDGEHDVSGRVMNLSVDGARLLVASAIPEDTMLSLRIRSEAGGDPLQIGARVVWCQPHEEGAMIGAAFGELSEQDRQAIARLTEWEIVEGGEKTRVVLKGDITEATNFKSLLPSVVGRVDFDLSQVEYMNSLGVREWVHFLKEASIRGYEFHACSVPFVLQASAVHGVLGRGTVASFFAPYVCNGCGHQEDRLLQSAAVLAADTREPPTFTCPECGDALELDELPERYLAFLRGDHE